MQTTFSQRLADLMAASEMSPFDLSLKAKTRENNVRQWLNGVIPDSQNLTRLAQAFEFPGLDEFLKGTELDPSSVVVEPGA